MKNLISVPFIVRLLAILLLELRVFTAMGQEGSQGNATIFSGAQMTFFGNHNFVAGGSGTQPGIIGTVRTAPYGILNFAATATTHTGAGDASHVDGYVRKLGAGLFIFPAGDNGQYGPFAASADGTTGAYFFGDPTTAVTSNLGGGNYPVLPAGGPFPSATFAGGLTAVSTTEYWDIDGANATSITLTWDAGSGVTALTGGTLNLLSITAWNGTNWVPLPSTVDVTSVLGGASTLTAGSITTTGTIVPDTYTAYTIGALNFPLPVDLLSFNAYKDRGNTQVIWKTGSEINASHFIIEHSDPANTRWSGIGTVTARGGTATVADYTFTHLSPVNGIHYYRLKMVDIGGTFSYSPVRTVYFNEKSNLVIYPNPAANMVYIQSANPGLIKGVRLIDMAGKEVKSSFPLLNSTMDISNAATGTYFLQVVYHDGSIDSHKLSIVK